MLAGYDNWKTTDTRYEEEASELEAFLEEQEYLYLLSIDEELSEEPELFSFLEDEEDYYEDEEY